MCTERGQTYWMVNISSVIRDFVSPNFYLLYLQLKTTNRFALEKAILKHDQGNSEGQHFKCFV